MRARARVCGGIYFTKHNHHSSTEVAWWNDVPLRNIYGSGVFSVYYLSQLSKGSSTI